MAFPRIGGAGIGLGLGAQTANGIDLPPGYCYVIPAGTYMVAVGPWSVVQFFDPVMQQWRTIGASNQQRGFVLESDGANFRLANLTGCPIAAVITNAGAGYSNGIGSAATGLTITPSAGGSVWVPIVGGAINATVAITAGGTGYNFRPLVVASPPPAGGYPALVRVNNVAGGAISTVIVDSQGAGYRTAPTLTVIPDPRDTNAQGAVLTVNPTLVGSGSLLGMYPSGNGGPVSAVPTFTFNPASTTAATAIMNFTINGVTVTGGGVAVPAGSSGIVIPIIPLLTAAANTDAYYYTTAAIGRPALIQLGITGGVIQQATTFAIDTGYGFQGTGAAFGLISSTGVAPTTGANITLAFGGTNDVGYLQPI